MLGCGNWSPKNLLKKGSSKRSKGASSRDLITRVVDMLTTEGVAAAATSDWASESCVRISIVLDDIWLLAGSVDMMPTWEERTSPTKTPRTRMTAETYNFFLVSMIANDLRSGWNRTVRGTSKDVPHHPV